MRGGIDGAEELRVEEDDVVGAMAEATVAKSSFHEDDDNVDDGNVVDNDADNGLTTIENFCPLPQ
jgi:hypothetical protein